MKTVCGIIGSLRKGSYNRGLMMAAVEVAKDAGLDIRIFDRIAELPVYNSDDDTDEKLPQSVVDFKQAIGDAAGLVIATPEYNYSVPGGLKNAIDWASRPAGRSPLNRKPAAIMGASTGIGGTIHARSDWQADAQVRDLDRGSRHSNEHRRDLRLRALPCRAYSRSGQRLVHTSRTPHPFV